MMQKTSLLSAAAAVLGVGALVALGARPPVKNAAASVNEPTEGTLYTVDKDGMPIGVSPLKHTDVNAEVSGFMARVSVVQEFTNNSQTPIEAVYKFPLPHDAAVDNMEMIIGKRVVKAQIKKKEDARKAYEDARNSGRRAALLDQERPNLFTQHVANIMPGDNVKIHIQYVETLKYEAGDYEFVFPMVVGPRYTPQEMANPEAVTVRRTPEGVRAGHDINIKVSVDAGMAIGAVSSPSHNVDVLKADAGRMMVALKNAQSIPNKDFVLRYDVAGAKIKDAVLTHKSQDKGGFVTLILQPPDRPVESEITPKEIVFVVDTSGSMHGYPMDKIKEVIKSAFDGLHPHDTFNLITFSGDEHILFPKPVPATRENIATAWRFMQTRDGRGGTEMMKAIRAALDPSDAQDHVRIVCFMTDGEVGNDMEILAEIQRHKNARVFAFGIGNSVNRFLLDGMSRYGRGETQFVTLSEDGSAAAKKFEERVRTPLLTDIEVDWNGLEVSDVYPQRVPDLFSAKPLVINARFAKGGKRTIHLRGKVAGKPYNRDIEVDLAASGPKHDVLATFWARRRVEELTAKDFRGIQYGQPNDQVKQQIIEIGLNFRLMTQFTSFVAVEEKVVNENGRPVRVNVPVEMPEGVSYDRIDRDSARKVAMAAPGRMLYRSSGAFGVGTAAESATVQPMPSTLPQQPRREVPRLALPKDEKEAAPASVTSKVHATLQTLQPGTLVQVQIWLNASSPAVIAKLKAAGLTVETANGNLIVGRVDAGKLEQIAAIAEVRSITPGGK
jgi:Ca-activated chloride channel family protein